MVSEKDFWRKNNNTMNDLGGKGNEKKIDKLDHDTNFRNDYISGIAACS